MPPASGTGHADRNQPRPQVRSLLLDTKLASWGQLNRAILASGWGQMERKLAYKAGRVVFVDPAYTSQTCSRCGHAAKSNRPSQAVFRCGACGFQAHADPNAAINILARAGLPHVPVQARGAGASARRGAFPPWPALRPAKGTPATRGPDIGVNSSI